MARPRLNSMFSIGLAALVVSSGCRSGSVATPLERGIATRLQDWFADSKPAFQPALFSLETESELHTALERSAKAAELPGAVLVVSAAQQTWMGATGQANLEKQVAMQPTERFRLGRLSEMFLAVVCLQLHEEGVLNLDDRLSDWLPAELDQQIPQSRSITIRQLLNHTSGLPDLEADSFGQAVAADPAYRWRIPELLDFMPDRESGKPRGSFSYSTANYLLLQLILEQATGSSLTEVLQSRIIKPLELKNTFVEFSSKQPFAQGYQDWNRDGTAENVTQPLLNTGLGLGGNALISNGPDLIRFLQALFFENTLLELSSRDKMLVLTEMNSGSYSLGISHVMTRWGEIWGQIDNTTGFSSAVLYLPIHDLILVTWTNSGDLSERGPGPKKNQASELAEAILDIILGHPPRFFSRQGGRW